MNKTRSKSKHEISMMVKQLLPMYQVFILNTVDVLLYTQKLLETSNKKQQSDYIFKNSKNSL